MSLVYDYYVNAAVVGSAFGCIIGGKGHGMAKTTHLHAVFGYSQGAKVVKNAKGAFGGKLPV
jgi:hypothetical protein